MPEQQIICIVARQRSGTTALQALLAKTGRVENFGEIFHTDRLDKPGSFYGYCAERKVLLSDVATGPALNQLLREYVSHLRELAGAQHVLIDVKFNSWDAVRPAWHYPQEEPHFLAFLKKLGTLFIFIRRMDIAAQIVSSYLARANDQWQNLSADAQKRPQLEIDLKKVEREARQICNAEAFLWRFLRRYDRVEGFTYETLYEGGGLATEARQALSAALDETLVFPDEAPIRKSEVDKLAAVRNYGEIVEAVEKITAKYRRLPEPKAITASL
jgi:LPS sulfotransferase NodH